MLLSVSSLKETSLWGKILFFCSNTVSYHQVELVAKTEQRASIQV